MTVTIELPHHVEVRLTAESEKTGVPVTEIAGCLLLEHFHSGMDRIGRLVADISAPIDVGNISREAIYAE